MLTWTTERVKDSLETLRNQPTIDVERNKYKKLLLDLTKKRVKMARDYMVSSVQRAGHQTHVLRQGLVRSAIKDQAEATRVGLQYLQVGANKAALEALCEQKDAQYNAAYLEFTKGELSPFTVFVC